jgi:hypothetical protein
MGGDVVCELDEDAWAVVVERELYGAVLDAAESGGVLQYLLSWCRSA